MTRTLALVTFAVFVLSSYAATSVAWAKPKVALTQIEGDASGDVRSAVAEAIESGKELSLIGSKDVNNAVDKLGAVAALTEKDLRKLATELEADAVVLGKLDRAAGGKTLKFRLYIHNKMAKGFTVSFKDPRSEKFRTMLHDKMVEKIGTSGGPPEAEDDKSAKKKPPEAADDDSLPPRKDAKDVKDAKDAKDAKPGSTAADDPAAKPIPAKPSPENAVKPAKEADDDASREAKKPGGAAGNGGGVAMQVAPARAGNRAAARLDLGISFAQRSFAFQTVAGANAPRDSALSPAAGLRFEAELYPLALGKPRGKLENLGIAGSYDYTLGLNVASASMPAASVPVAQSGYSIGLRYRLAFGTTPTSATLTFGFGYGQRTFRPELGRFQNQQAATDVARDAPATDYAVLDPGLKFRLPLTPRFAVSLGARGLVVLSAGGIQDAASYGQATVYGADAALALDIMLGRRFAVRLAGEFAQLGFSFAGKGALSNNVDGDPASKDVSGLSDRSIGGTATVAVVY